MLGNSKDISQYDAWQQLRIFQRNLNIDRTSLSTTPSTSGVVSMHQRRSFKKLDNNEALPPLVTVSSHDSGPEPSRKHQTGQ